jgi:hypothetical protein
MIIQIIAPIAVSQTDGLSAVHGYGEEGVVSLSVGDFEVADGSDRSDVKVSPRLIVLEKGISITDLPKVTVFEVSKFSHKTVLLSTGFLPQVVQVNEGISAVAAVKHVVIGLVLPQVPNL